MLPFSDEARNLIVVSPPVSIFEHIFGQVLRMEFAKLTRESFGVNATFHQNWLIWSEELHISSKNATYTMKNKVLLG